MSNKVLLKKSSVGAKVPLTTDLDYGELALNYADGKLYFKTSNNLIQSIDSSSYTRVVANTTAAAGRKYIADTSSGTFTITLPASPASGDSVTIADGASFLTTPLTVARNGSTIEGIADNLTLNISGVSVTLTYDGTTWQVYTQVGAQGGTEVTLGGIQTLTNKTISGSANTLTNIPNSALTNSSIIVNGSAISLGGSVSGLVTLTGTETLTNKTLTSPTINAGALSGTFSGDHTLSGIVTLNYTGAGATSTLNLLGYNSKGGTGYHDFLKVTNGYGSATNPTKWMRINSTGELQIINSAYTSQLLTLSDAGDMTVLGNITSSGAKSGYSSGRPAFRVYGSTGTAWGTTVNTSGYLNSSQFTVDYNQGSYLNTTTGVFTAPVAGLYQVNVTGRNAGNAAYSQIAVVKNATGGNGSGGSIGVMVEWAGSSSMNHTGGGTTLLLAVNDTLALKVLAGTVNFDSNDNWSVAYIG